jgi:hypothetical protein
MTKPAHPPKRPTDPVQLAHAVTSEALGLPDAAPVPEWVKVAGDVATCGGCGKTYALSKRANAREEDLRAFGILHRH